MEAIKKFYAELPTDQEIYRQMFKCKNCAEIAIPTPANSIYCTKGHVYCTKCRGHGDLCGWKISGENTTEAGSVCSWRIDCNIVDTFAPRVFQLLSFPWMDDAFNFVSRCQDCWDGTFCKPFYLTVFCKY